VSQQKPTPSCTVKPVQTGDKGEAAFWGAEEIEKQCWTLEKINFRKLFPQLMDGV